MSAASASARDAFPGPLGQEPGFVPGTVPHALTASEVLERLQCDPVGGLRAATVDGLRARVGWNELEQPPRVTRRARLARQFRSLVVWVLIAAAALSLLLQEIVDALAISAIVVLDAGIGFFQEERAAQALEALERYAAPNARIVRDGTATVVSARELVPGDLIEVEAGDHVPADARLVRASALEVQEAALTGESQPVAKHAEPSLQAATPLAERANLIHMGTVVTAGRARAVVTTIGMRTELGRIAGLLERAASPPTPLQRRLEGLGRLLVVVCLLLVALTAALQLARGGELIEVLMLAVSLAVAAIPEGLPVVVTVALALGLQRLVRRRALVRNLPSVETLGSVTVICSDKTGTLTRNEMMAREVWAGGRRFQVSGSGYDPRGELSLVQSERAPPVDARADPDLAAALRTAALCNNAQLVAGDQPDDPWRVVGDPTEGALLTLARKGGISTELEPGERLALELPFDSERRAMTVVTADARGERTVHTKGAPEVVLALCARQVVGGREVELTETRRAQALAEARRMGASALRVLALAHRRGVSEVPSEVERELCLLALVGLQDPPREGARSAIETCRAAGVRPVMVTGDHPDTARAIAEELGLLQDDAQAVRGVELDGWDDAELAARSGTVAVFARVTAEHKLRIVQALQRSGHVVAMTGDGVNDAPALREADIGVAMGRSGTDVTRAASDMVLLDDDFGTIVAAIEEGRCIFDDITKFVHYLLATNAAEVLVVLAAVVGGWPVPLLPVQILWINLVTDSFPALALGLEPPERDLMRRPPRSPRSPVVSLSDGAWLLACGLLVALVASAGFALSWHQGLGLEHARTAAFHVLVLSQLSCAFAFRSRRRTALGLGLLTNRPLVAAVVAGLALQGLLLSWEPARDLFGCVALDAGYWALSVGLALLPATLLELTKLALSMARRSG